MSETILVTGGAGFIGSHLVEQLALSGKRVLVIDNLSSGARTNIPKSPSVELIVDDIQNVGSYREYLGEVRTVYHLAARISGYESLNDPHGYITTNVSSIISLLDVLAEPKETTILFASSSAVYGNQPTSGPLNESAPTIPSTIYGLTKLMGEHVLRIYSSVLGYRHVSLRLFNVYGPRQSHTHPYANALCHFVYAVTHQLPLIVYGTGEQSRDFIYIDDVVDAFLAAASRGESSVYNVATGVGTSINGLIGELSALIGDACEVTHADRLENDIFAIAGDNQRLQTELRLTPRVSLLQGLQSTIDYFIGRSA